MDKDKLRQFIKATIQEVITEGRVPDADKKKIVDIMKEKSFLNYRKDLEKMGIKVEFTSSPFGMYMLNKKGWKTSIAITHKKNTDDAEFINNDNIAMGEMNNIYTNAMKNLGW